MIGNLVLSLLAATFVGGVVFAGHQNADFVNQPDTGVVAQSTSIVNETDVYVPAIEFDVGVNVSVNSFLFNDRVDYWGFNSHAVSSMSVSGFDDVVPYDHYFVGIGYHGNRTTHPTYGYIWRIDYYISSSSESIFFNGLTYVLDGVEFFPTFIFRDSDSNVLTGNFTYQFFVDDVLVDSGNTYGMGAKFFVGGSLAVKQDFYKLSLSFHVNDLPSGTASVSCGFGGQWCCNYRSSSGFALGYSQGLTDGYNKGYSDGLQVSSSGFHALFNSIADTPLRFLYGLFNFDLFGLSMLVIVLSLLTGLIVFGIVKKFWK